MSKEIKLMVLNDGKLISPYSDELLELVNNIGGTIHNIERASRVEWEKFDNKSGWSVRSNHNPSLAIRNINGKLKVSVDGSLVLFKTREEALQSEVENFWELLPCKSELQD